MYAFKCLNEEGALRNPVFCHTFGDNALVLDTTVCISAHIEVRGLFWTLEMYYTIIVHIFSADFLNCWYLFVHALFGSQ